MANSALTSPVIPDPTKANDGSVASPSFAFKNEPGFGFYRISSGNIGLTSGGVSRFQIHSFGAYARVGIGQTNPVHTLDMFNGSSTTTMRLGTGSEQLIFSSGNPVDFSAPFIQTASSGFRITAPGSPNSLVLRPGNVGVGINTDVGLGSSVEALSVKGYLSTQTVASFQTGSSSDIGTIQFVNLAGTGVGSISFSATSTFYSTISDYRLKEQVKPLSNALSRIEQLKPCTYKWKANGAVAEGFLAHELADVCPTAVLGDKDANDTDGKIIAQSVDQSKLIALLTAGIQELSAQNKKLEERLQMLEAKHGS